MRTYNHAHTVININVHIDTHIIQTHTNRYGHAPDTQTSTQIHMDATLAHGYSQTYSESQRHIDALADTDTHKGTPHRYTKRLTDTRI